MNMFARFDENPAITLQDIKETKPRLGMSVTMQGGSGRQYVTGPGRKISKYRLVLLNVYRFWDT